MRKRIEIEEGQKFGRLTIVKETIPTIYPSRQKRAFQCICECGIEKIVQLNHLRNNSTKSCGCYGVEKRIESVKISNTKHSDTRKIGSLYKTWNGIKSRCYLEKATGYKNYGGRGIKMYKPWIKDYSLFKEWIINNIGNKLEGYSLDRINNDGNYEPNNLRWATSKEQNNNRRKTT